MRLPIIVVYRTSSKGRKFYMKVFTDLWLEDIIDSNRRKPPIPHEYELVEIGMGTEFIEKYKKEYGITKIEENETV